MRVISCVLATMLSIGVTMVRAGDALIDPDHPPDKSSPEMQWWRDGMATHDQRMTWWRQARFGMFIHWGIYSRLGGTWNGKEVHGYGEHIMRILKIPLAQYRSDVAGQFDPVHFDANTWVSLAKQAGMGYIVITAKHHDGFAMFDSHVTDYNVVQATPWHHDPMKDLKAACAAQGLHFGFYYSQAFDWQDPDAPGNDWDYNNPGGDHHLHGGINWWDSPDGAPYIPRVEHYVDTKAIPQLRELIAQYHPDIFWFDTSGKMSPYENWRVMRAVRAASPAVLINGRLVRGYGDYDSTTDRPAEFPPHPGDWEGIPTTNESYGYNQNDHSQKPPSHFIRLLAKACARGGNLLMNIGPRGDGTFDPADVVILQGIAAWMKVNGDSIHGTERTPLPVQPWGESTRKGNLLYLHVFNWPADGQLRVGGLLSPVKAAYLLSDSQHTPLAVQWLDSTNLDIGVPHSPPDNADSVVVIETDANMLCDSARAISGKTPTLLRTFDANLHGPALKYGPGKKNNDYLINWTSPQAYITWQIRADAPGRYQITANYDASTQSDGNTLSLAIATHSLTAQVHSGEQISQPLGSIKIPAGPQEIRVIPQNLAAGELCNLRSITLTRAN